MSQISVDVPAELAPAIRAVVEHYVAFRAAALGGSDEVGFGAAEAELDERVAHLESTAPMSMLAALDTKCRRIEVSGVTFRRLNQPSSGVYSALRGEARIERSLYRQIGVKDGPTVVPTELRAGIVEGRYTPAAANASAQLAQARRRSSRYPTQHDGSAREPHPVREYKCEFFDQPGTFMSDG